MKKTLIIIFLSIFISCEKPKTWECTCDYFNIPYGSGEDITTISNTRQTPAKRQCNNRGKELAGEHGEYSCEIEVKR